MSQLQTFIKQKLEEKNISVKELERRAGLKSNAVHNILHGRSKHPKQATLEAIAHIFECSVRDLVISKYESADTSIEPLSKTAPLGSHTPWDPLLYIAIIKTLDETLAKKPLLPPSKKIHTLIWEIYLYTLSHEDKKIDPRFVEWIVNKYL